MADRHHTDPHELRDNVPPLRRETMVVVNERGRVAVLVALCSLAGIAMGFGLSNMATAHRCHRAAHVTPAMERSWQTWAPTWLGVAITDGRTGDTRPDGARVLEVVDGSPAQVAGFERGDRVVYVDGEAVDSASELVSLVRSHQEGERVEIVLDRQGRMETVEVYLGRLPLSVLYD